MLMPVKEESLRLNAGAHILFLLGCYLISILGINTEGRKKEKERNEEENYCNDCVSLCERK